MVIALSLGATAKLVVGQFVGLSQVLTILTILLVLLVLVLAGSCPLSSVLRPLVSSLMAVNSILVKIPPL